MRTPFFPFFSLVIYSASVGANLYPTRPIANTVFRRGSWNDITWIDDHTSPSLSQLGNILEIDLWRDDEDRLATLATNVDPRAMSLNVYIPSILSSDMSNFVLRFKFIDPPMTIYTANFAIDDTNGNRSSYPGGELLEPSPNSVALSGASAPTQLPSGGINDLVTVTMVMSESTSAPLPSATIPGAVAAMSNDASNGGRHVRRPNMQFNFIFVLFPALFGVVMAL